MPLRFVLLEQPVQKGHVGRLEIVLRKLDLLLEADVSIAHTRSPLQVEHVVDAIQEHADPLAAVGDLRGDRGELDPARLLEVGELADLHPVHQDLPSHPRGPQGGRLPVVLVEADVVLLRIDSEGGQRFEIQILDVVRRRLQDHLELIVTVDPERVLAVAAVHRASGGGAVCDAPRLRPEDAEEGVRVHRPRPDLHVVRLLQHGPLRGPELLQRQDQLLKIERHVSSVLSRAPQIDPRRARSTS